MTTLVIPANIALMNKVILISDIDTELGFQLLKQYYPRGYKVIATVSGTPKPIKEMDPGRLEILSWNRTSTLGVKNLLYKGLERFKGFKEALVLQTQTLDQEIITHTSLTDLDRYIDRWLKGNIALLKELIGYFNRKGTGSITVINNLDYPREQYGSLIGEILDKTFESVMDNLYRLLKESPVDIRGFQSSTKNSESFAEFIFRALEDKGKRGKGKTIHFNEKKGLFK